MKRRFAVPAAIALTAHALLFVGSGKPPVPGGNKPQSNAADDPRPVIEVVDDTPPILADDNDNTGPKSDEEAPPSIIEPPPMIFPSGPEIIQKYVYVKPGTATTLTALNVGRPKETGSREKALTIDMLDDKPRTRFQKEPVYPRMLKSAGTTGTVWVEFMVDETGRVHDVRVQKSTHPGFEDATLTAVSQWRFEPGKHKGILVRFRMSIPVVFNLTE